MDHSRRRLASLAGCVAATAGIALGQPDAARAPSAPTEPAAPVEFVASDVVIAADPSTPRPPYTFSAEDEAFLTEVQRGCFNFLWNAGDPATGMVPDRSSITTVSVAGVGFQLSAFPVGVARGWITPAQALDRTRLILDTLTRDPRIRHNGLFQHYIDGVTGGPHSASLEHVVSTIDSALLHAGLLTIATYLREPTFAADPALRDRAKETADLADTLFAEANWRAFVSGDWTQRPHERGFVSLGWRPAKNADGTPDYNSHGQLLPYYWIDSGCEHRLVVFLGVAAPREQNRLDPAMYYRLRRALGVGADPTKPMAYFPYSGALFVSQFSHVWINYAKLGPDNPHAFGMIHRARVDWWENSRRLHQLHIDACKTAPTHAPHGPHHWGMTASDAPKGYAVPGVFPTPATMRGATPEFDFSVFTAANDFGDGTLAPYGPGSAILFMPDAAIAAMRHYRALAETDKAPGLWTDPAAGGYGFQDAFNPNAPREDGGSGAWVAHDVVAIDAGPLILMIENARTGMVQDLFMRHEFVKGAMERLGLDTPAGR